MTVSLPSSGSIRIASNPADPSIVSSSPIVAAPETQAGEALGIAAELLGYVGRQDDVAGREPTARSKDAKRLLEDPLLVGREVITQFERIASIVPSTTGRCSISPGRNSTFVASSFAAFSRARSTISRPVRRLGYSTRHKHGEERDLN